MRTVPKALLEFHLACGGGKAAFSDYNMAKNVLIVFAHPEKESFNAALLNSAVNSLRSQGHIVKVSDLYENGFNAILSRNDVKGEKFGPSSIALDFVLILPFVGHWPISVHFHCLPSHDFIHLLTFAYL